MRPRRPPRSAAVLGVAVAVVAACGGRADDPPRAGEPVAETSLLSDRGAATSPPTSTGSPASAPPTPSTPAGAPGTTATTSVTRVRFGPGEDHATIRGTAPPGVRQTYVLGASAGQYVELRVPAANAARWELRSPADVLVLAVGPSGDATFTRRVLPADGDERLTVDRSTAGAYEADVRIAGRGVPTACADASCGIPSWADGSTVRHPRWERCAATPARVSGTAPGVAGLDAHLTSAASAFVNSHDGTAPASCTWRTASLTLTPTLAAVTVASESFVEGAAYPLDDIHTVVWDLRGNRRVPAAELLVAGTDQGAASWRRLFALVVERLRPQEPTVDLSGVVAPGLDGGAQIAPTATGLRVGFGRCALVGCALHSVTVDVPYTALDGIVDPAVRRVFEGPADEVLDRR